MVVVTILLLLILLLLLLIFASSDSSPSFLIKMGRLVPALPIKRKKEEEGRDEGKEDLQE